MADRVFQNPVWVESVSSTNSALLDRLAGGERLPSGYVLAAREQTGGRGRFDRRWVSHSGRDLTFSFYLPDPSAPGRLASLPMAAALAVADAAGSMGVSARTKWPNDVITPRGKLCGILSERARDGVVVGIGVNLNMTRDEASAIDQPATSLLMETGLAVAPGDALESVLAALEPVLAAWRGGGFAAIRDAWTSRCAYVGERITITDAGSSTKGILSGFGEEGDLLLREADGTTRRVWSGDLRHHLNVELVDRAR